MLGCTVPSGMSCCRYSTSENAPKQRLLRENKVSEAKSVAAARAEKLAADLAARTGQVMLDLFPRHYMEMTWANHRARPCRLGDSPFSAVAINRNFVAHNHLDKNDLPGGLSAVLTVTALPGPCQQFHCLPGITLPGCRDEGVALLMPTGSLLFEAARHYHHLTTRLPSAQPARRLSLVFFQHKGLSLPFHGAEIREAGQHALVNHIKKMEVDARSLDLDALTHKLNSLWEMMDTMIGWGAGIKHWGDLSRRENVVGKTATKETCSAPGSKARSKEKEYCMVTKGDAAAAASVVHPAVADYGNTYVKPPRMSGRAAEVGPSSPKRRKEASPGPATMTTTSPNPEGELFPCDVCKTFFDTDAALEEHEGNVHGGGDEEGKWDSDGKDDKKKERRIKTSKKNKLGRSGGEPIPRASTSSPPSVATVVEEPDFPTVATPPTPQATPGPTVPGEKAKQVEEAIETGGGMEVGKKDAKAREKATQSSGLEGSIAPPPPVAPLVLDLEETSAEQVTEENTTPEDVDFPEVETGGDGHPIRPLDVEVGGAGDEKGEEQKEELGKQLATPEDVHAHFSSMLARAGESTLEQILERAETPMAALFRRRKFSSSEILADLSCLASHSHDADVLSLMTVSAI